MEKLKKIFLKYKEIITYILVGGVTTLVRWGTTAIFEKVFAPFGLEGLSLSITVTVVSLAVTILFAFPPNKLIVFESRSFRKDIVIKEFIAFISARAAASIIELVGIPAISEMFSVPTLATTMIVSLVVLVVNYVLSKVFIFKKRELKEADREDESKKADTNKKDKLTAGVLMAVCAVVAVVSVGFFTIEAVSAVIEKLF